MIIHASNVVHVTRECYSGFEAIQDSGNYHGCIANLGPVSGWIEIHLRLTAGSFHISVRTKQPGQNRLYQLLSKYVKTVDLVFVSTEKPEPHVR